MIVEERMTTYLNSLDCGSGPFLDELERQAREERIPVIRRQMQSFLKILLAIRQPVRILEVGTAVGFSALLMCRYTPETTTITTIENYDKRIAEARENFRRAGMEPRITLLEGDAAEILKELQGSYDFIFMDAAKGQYIHFFPEVFRLLEPGGILVSDNVLQEGDLIESHFAVERRNRTIYKRMREYLYTLKHHEELITSVLPVGDGAAVSVKRANPDVGKDCGLQCAGGTRLAATEMKRPGDVHFAATVAERPGDVHFAATDAERPGDVRFAATDAERPGDVRFAATDAERPGNVRFTAIEVE